MTNDNQMDEHSVESEEFTFDAVVQRLIASGHVYTLYDLNRRELIFICRGEERVVPPMDLN